MIGDSKTKPMEILLVEDGWTDARVTIHALRRSQVYHRLTLVRSVHEAIHFLERKGIFARAPRPDLLLLDMMLPESKPRPMDLLRNKGKTRHRAPGSSAEKAGQKNGQPPGNKPWTWNDEL